ncbi:hypothetical protein L6164_016393 [Bauhinia variegata]|uniref:Uncharacterized protein n=1 Tax=Bauhinia variegata TaxID=167791 RepID=A0ACB9NNA2_BAUVA|nr:hypothetical protein L6164_016393 [Bauhinia variegata]
MAPPFQAAILWGSPSYPNAIAWSEDNLIAVASGNLVTILRPAVTFGPRGLITITASEPPAIGVVERKDILSGCLLPICLSRDDQCVVRSISWSPLGMASNSGCLLTVCTTEGHVKVYRPPFCEFRAEWVEVVDITERLYEYLQRTGFRDLDISSFHRCEMQVESRRSADEMPNPVSMKEQKRSVSASKSKGKSSKEISENQMITADQYTSRSAMLCSIVVSWSPLLHVTSELSPIPNIYASISLLAIGAKSGKISFWRFHAPDCYNIEDGRVPIAVKFVGLLQAHDSWVTTISWLLFASDSSNPKILLATGSSDGSVRIWLGNNDKLLKSSEVNHASFLLLKEVITVNIVPVSVLSATVLDQSLSKMLLAIGKGSGSFEIWLCDISCSEFVKLGSYDAHEHVVTGLVWAFGGRILYSCSQDNSVRSWILREDRLDEVAISYEIPDSSNSTCPPADVFGSCNGVAVSPGSLVIATVHCFERENLNRMYEGRIYKAAVEYFWIGGHQADVLSKTRFLFNTEEHPRFQEKELDYWDANIIWSLKQYQCLDKPLVLWDIIAALSSFKKYNSEYVEHILMKWLSTAFLGSESSDTDLPVEKVLSRVCSTLSDSPSRLLHILNIICRRVVLADLSADQINQVNSKMQNLEGLFPAIEKKLAKWIEILMSSEREIRERLVGFCFSSFLTNMSYQEAIPSQPGHWRPDGLAQMEQWIALDQDHVRDQLKALASEVGTYKGRVATSEYFSEERCSYCSAPVPFESPEVGFCGGEDNNSGSGHRHRLSRCSVSMQVCPITPSWFCVCCHRSAFKLAPETLFKMSAYPLDLKSSTESSSQAVSSRPLCPFCGILLQKPQLDFLLSPSPL